MLRSRLAIYAVIASLLFSTDVYAQTTKRKKSSAEKAASSSNKDENASESSPSPKEKADKSDDDDKREMRPSSIGELMEKLDYPELQVVPRASERLRIEAIEERSSWYYTHWQIMLSGLATAYTATTFQERSGMSEQEKADAGSVKAIGQAIGFGWVGAGILIGLQRPYRAGVTAISKYEGKDTRSMIMRERLAEEALEKPARLMGPIRTAAVISNFALCLGMGVFMSDEGRITAGVSALLAFLPSMYEDHTIRVYEKHLEYKSKIYGPISSLAPAYDPLTKSFAPVARLTWNF